MAVTYKNTRTGRVVELDQPNELMDRSTRWERVEDEKTKPAKARKTKAADDETAGE